MPPLFHLIQFALVVLMQNFLRFNVGYLGKTVVRELCWALLPTFLLLGRVDLILLLLDKLHELVDGVQRIIIHLFVFLAARAVNVLVLLADQVLNNSFHLWRQISLRPIPLKWLYMFGKLFHVNVMLLLLPFFYPFANFFVLVCIFHLNEFGLMNPELVF